MAAIFAIGNPVAFDARAELRERICAGAGEKLVLIHAPAGFGKTTLMLQVMTALQQNQASLVNVIQTMDTLLARIQAGNGTLGMLATDSTLYSETAATMKQFRELMTDFQAHPRKYIKISVF